MTTPREGQPNAGDSETPETPDEYDSDGDSGQLNPRDLRGIESGDGALDQGKTDGDPEQLNPRTG